MPVTWRRPQQEFGPSITRRLVCQFMERKTLLRYAVQAIKLRKHLCHQFKRCRPCQAPFYQLVNRFRRLYATLHQRHWLLYV
ncbi:hypothetical protein WJX77_003982 [Trebouxia sp. C0004]